VSAFVAEYRARFGVEPICSVLGVSASAFYERASGRRSHRSIEDEQLLHRIREVHEANYCAYGYRRTWKALLRAGEDVGRDRVKRLMRQHGLRGRSSRPRRVCTTHSDHDQPVAPNRLLGRAAPTRINEVWVADITYVPTAQGWVFVAAIMDLYSRQILGWSVWDSLHAGGALQALKRALVKRNSPKGVIHHSDRGVQYACCAYRHELHSHGLVPSMSRRGNCYDNAAREAFWSTLKREAMAPSATWSKDRVRRELFEYIEGHYNRSRLHSSLGYQSPVDFENQTS